MAGNSPEVTPGIAARLADVVERAGPALAGLRGQLDKSVEDAIGKAGDPTAGERWRGRSLRDVTGDADRLAAVLTREAGDLGLEGVTRTQLAGGAVSRARMGDVERVDATWGEYARWFEGNVQASPLAKVLVKIQQAATQRRPRWQAARKLSGQAEQLQAELAEALTKATTKAFSKSPLPTTHRHAVTAEENEIMALPPGKGRIIIQVARTYGRLEDVLGAGPFASPSTLWQELKPLQRRVEELAQRAPLVHAYRAIAKANGPMLSAAGEERLLEALDSATSEMLPALRVAAQALLDGHREVAELLGSEPRCVGLPRQGSEDERRVLAALDAQVRGDRGWGPRMTDGDLLTILETGGAVADVMAQAPALAQAGAARGAPER